METFIAGQSSVVVVLSGVGRCKVVAPVRCTRKVTSCAFCDSAAGFSCVHAVRARGVRRTQSASKRADHVSRSDEEDGARSRLPRSLYNCPASVKANIAVCRAMEMGKPYVVTAPSSCPKCHTTRDKCRINKEVGTIICSSGFCVMELESLWCPTTGCQTQIYPDGRDAGVVIWSSSFAATAVFSRDIAREMATSGSTFGACYKHWYNKYVDLQDSGAYPDMVSIKEKSRPTISSVFHLTVRLMVKDPPIWAFRCGSCQDKDGRYRVVTADGIWLGFLKRLSSGKYVNPTQPCASVKATVEAASLHPSEWVRRFVRTSLKQPKKAVVIKAGQLRSAMRAFEFMCPGALPAVTEKSLTQAKQIGLGRLRSLLFAVWDLDASSLTLCDAIIVHVKKLVAPRNTLPEGVRASHLQTLQDLAAWKERVRQGAIPGGLGAPQPAAAAMAAGAPVLAGVGVGGGAGGAGGEGEGDLAPAPHGGGAPGGAWPQADEAGGVGGAAAAAGGGGAPGGAANQVVGGDGGVVPHAVAGGGGGDGGGGGQQPAAPAEGGGAPGGAVDQAGGADGGGGGGQPAAPAGGGGGPGGGADQVGGEGDGVEPAAAAGGGGARVRAPIAAAGGGGAGEPVLVAAAGGENGAGHVGGANRARRPAAAARARHLERTTAEPGDPRFLRPWIKSLGATQYKDILSFCVAIAVDPVVNPFKERHGQALSHLSSCLRHDDACNMLGALFSRVDGAPGQPDLSEADTTIVSLLRESRMVMCFLSALSSNEGVFNRVRHIVADVLLTIRDAVKDYHVDRSARDDSAAQFQQKWGDPTTSPEELRRRFLAAYPQLSEDPLVTGAFFPGLLRCRPGAFAANEVPELGLCAKHYEEAHKFFSPGTFTICCACAHPKMIGFVVLDKREGPPALLNAILSYFALLPMFVVYDFGCGALRSALGKLRFFLALVVLVSDLFHIVNHLCSDALHPRSYADLDGVNSVAHEQRNAPINLMRRSLRACGQDEYMSILQLENILYNVMAHARSSSTYPLREDYNFRKFYFSKNPCVCGCMYNPDAPPVPTAPVAAEAPVAEDEEQAPWDEGEDW